MIDSKTTKHGLVDNSSDTSDSHPHRYATSEVREQRVVDIFFENFSISDLDHGSISPILNAICLLIQRPIVLSLVGVSDYIRRKEVKIQRREEPFSKLIAHSIKPKYKNTNFKYNKMLDTKYNYDQYYRDRYGEFYSELRNITKNQFKNNGLIFSELPTEVNLSIRDEGNFSNHYEIKNSDDDPFKISIDGKIGERSIIFDRLFIVFNFVEIETEPGKASKAYSFLPLNKADSKSVKRVLHRVLFDKKFGGAILSNFLANMSDVDRKTHVNFLSNAEQFKGDELINTPLTEVMHDLFEDFRRSVILRPFLGEELLDKPPELYLPNFLLAVRAPTQGRNNAVRIILSDQQQAIISNILTTDCDGISRERAAEILSLAQRPIDYERSIEYRSLPFQETIGYWNLKNFNIAELSLDELNCYNARRIIYALLFGERGGGDNELLERGDKLGITVFPFHFIGSPYAHIIKVTSPFENSNQPEDNYLRWEDNTLAYSGFQRAFSRKFRARLRTTLLRYCYASTRRAFDWTREREAGTSPKLLGPKLDRLNCELELISQTFPILRYSLILREPKSEERKTTSIEQIGTDERGSIHPIFVGKWGQDSLYLKYEENENFFRNYAKSESSYTTKFAREIGHAIAEARRSWSESVNYAERVFISECSYHFANCNIILLVSDTGEFLEHSNWDFAYECCRKFNPARSHEEFSRLQDVIKKYTEALSILGSQNVISLSSSTEQMASTQPWIVSSDLDPEISETPKLSDRIGDVLDFLEMHSDSEHAPWPKVFLMSKTQFVEWDSALRGRVGKIKKSDDGLFLYEEAGEPRRQYAGALDLDKAEARYRNEVLRGVSR